jgi:chromosome segregation ATPase
MGFLFEKNQGAPTALAEPPKSKGDVAKLQQDLDDLKKSAADQAAAIERRIAEKKSQQERLAQLERQFDDASDALLLADSQHAADKNQMAGLEQDLIDLWSKPRNARNPESRVNGYNGLAILRLAVSDFPRVRQVLAARLADAEAALEAFKQQL